MVDDQGNNSETTISGLSLVFSNIYSRYCIGFNSFRIDVCIILYIIADDFAPFGVLENKKFFLPITMCAWIDAYFVYIVIVSWQIHKKMSECLIYKAIELY